MTKKIQASDEPLSEAAWWDRYGQINEDIWHYNAYLNKVVREEYLQQIQTFLYHPEGKLLDFGCGGGWVSLPIARQGMPIVGIDVSKEQIQRAYEKAKQLDIKNANYICGNMNAIATTGTYQSILLHSVLHHLFDEEKQKLLDLLDKSLVSGGHIYLYEPIAVNPKRSILGSVLDKCLIAIFRVLQWLALISKAYLPEIDHLVRQKWTMLSPDEAPILQQELEAFLPKTWQIIEIKYWQMCSMKYANFCMSLKPFWRVKLQTLTPFVYRFDQFILNTKLRDSFKLWPMVSFLIKKEE